MNHPLIDTIVEARAKNNNAFVIAMREVFGTGTTYKFVSEELLRDFLDQVEEEKLTSILNIYEENSITAEDVFDLGEFTNAEDKPDEDEEANDDNRIVEMSIIDIASLVEDCRQEKFDLQDDIRFNEKKKESENKQERHEAKHFLRDAKPKLVRLCRKLNFLIEVSRDALNPLCRTIVLRKENEICITEIHGDDSIYYETHVFPSQDYELDPQLTDTDDENQRKAEICKKEEEKKTNQMIKNKAKKLSVKLLEKTDRAKYIKRYAKIENDEELLNDVRLKDIKHFAIGHAGIHYIKTKAKMMQWLMKQNQETKQHLLDLLRGKVAEKDSDSD